MAKPRTVVYDRMTTWDSKPYRTEPLYRNDKYAAMNVKPGNAVQVITERGDAEWSDATMLRWEHVPNSDGSMIRFYVTLANGAVHMVSEDRIRVP